MGEIFIDKIGLIHIKDRKALVTLEKGKDKWYITGGKREKGETDQQTLTREIKEELSVNLNPKTLEYYGTFEAPAHDQPKGTIVKIACYTGVIDEILKPNNEIEKYKYLSYSQKDDLTIIGKLIFEDLKKKNLID